LPANDDHFVSVGDCRVLRAQKSKGRHRASREMRKRKRKRERRRCRKKKRKKGREDLKKRTFS